MEEDIIFEYTNSNKINNNKGDDICSGLEKKNDYRNILVEKIKFLNNTKTF